MITIYRVRSVTSPQIYDTDNEEISKDMFSPQFTLLTHTLPRTRPKTINNELHPKQRQSSLPDRLGFLPNHGRSYELLFRTVHGRAQGVDRMEQDTSVDRDILKYLDVA